MQTPTGNKTKMSSSLKERLKRSGRSYHTSPVIKAARQDDICEAKCLAVDLLDTNSQSHENCNTNLPHTIIPKSVSKLDCVVKHPSNGSQQNIESQSSIDKENLHDLDSSRKSHCETCECNQSCDCTHPWDSSQPGASHVHPDVQPEFSVQTRHQLQKLVAEKEERIRKLQMVKMYRIKNNLSDLDQLTGKWRQVAQQALHELLDTAPEPKPSLTELVNSFQLDHSFIEYSAEEEAFL